MAELISIFIFLFAVIDPIGSVPVFIAVTSNLNEKEKRITAFKAVLVSFVVLQFFIIAGEIILNAIEVPLPAFQIAGGIVLFLFALTMIFGDSKPDDEIKSVRDPSEIAIYPMAMPSIASPGAMLAVVLLTKKLRIQCFRTSTIQLGYGQCISSCFSFIITVDKGSQINWFSRSKYYK